MGQIDDACNRLRKWTATLHERVEAGLEGIRTASAAEAELELEALLSALDEVNEAAGDCLAEVQDRVTATVEPAA